MLEALAFAGLPGPAYLYAYVVVAAAALALAFMRRRTGRLPDDEPTPDVVRGLHPYEAALLEHGERGALAAALGQLEATRVIVAATSDDERKRVTLALAEPGARVVEPSHPLEHELLALLGPAPVELTKELHGRLAAATSFAAMRDGLERKGLLVDVHADRAARHASAVAPFLVALLAVPRIVHALCTGHDVGFLVMAAFATLFAGVVCLESSLTSTPTLRGQRACELARAARARRRDEATDTPAWDIALGGPRTWVHGVALLVAAGAVTGAGGGDGGCGDGGGCGGCGCGGCG